MNQSCLSHNSLSRDMEYPCPSLASNFDRKHLGFCTNLLSILRESNNRTTDYNPPFLSSIIFNVAIDIVILISPGLQDAVDGSLPSAILATTELDTTAISPLTRWPSLSADSDRHTLSLCQGRGDAPMEGPLHGDC